MKHYCAHGVFCQHYGENMDNFRIAFKVTDAPLMRCPFGTEFHPPIAFCVGTHCAAFEEADAIVDETFRLNAANPEHAASEETRLRAEGWQPFVGPNVRSLYGVSLEWWRGKVERGRCAR